MRDWISMQSRQFTQAGFRGVAEQVKCHSLTELRSKMLSEKKQLAGLKDRHRRKGFITVNRGKTKSVLNGDLQNVAQPQGMDPIDPQSHTDIEI